MSQEDAENVVDPQETDADQQDNEETPVEGEIKEGEEVEEKTQQIRCLIENSQVGGIIGKAGVNVKRIRDDTDVFLSILKADYRAVTERIMLLKGTIVQISKAMNLVAELLIEAANQKENAETNSTTIKLLVHRSLVGAIIGKGGQVIKETQAETGARIQISNEALPQSTEKTVGITGTPEALEATTEKILSQLAAAPLKTNHKNYPYIPGSLPSPIYQNPYGIPAAVGYGSPIGLYHQQSAHLQAYSGLALGAGPTSTQKIAIPTVCAGCIIGKQGAVIRDIRMQSQTTINIADPDQNAPNERVVTLTGPPQGIQAAIFLIRQLVEQYQPQQ